MLTYIGQYFCQTTQSPEELIGEFYEFLSVEQIYSLYNHAGSQFDIGGYTVIVDNVCSMRVLKRYDLKYTAGTYYIPSHHLIGSKSKIKRKMNLEAKSQ
jgi:hypothetical protein